MWLLTLFFLLSFTQPVQTCEDAFSSEVQSIHDCPPSSFILLLFYLILTTVCQNIPGNQQYVVWLIRNSKIIQNNSKVDDSNNGFFATIEDSERYDAIKTLYNPDKPGRIVDPDLFWVCHFLFFKHGCDNIDRYFSFKCQLFQNFHWVFNLGKCPTYSGTLWFRKLMFCAMNSLQKFWPTWSQGFRRDTNRKPLEVMFRTFWTNPGTLSWNNTTPTEEPFLQIPGFTAERFNWTRKI